MGWMKYLVLGDLGQQMDIEDQKREISRIKGQNVRRRISEGKNADRHKKLAAKVKELEMELDEMKLYMVSLINLLAESNSLDKDRFNEIIKEIDMLDGKKDGRLRTDMPI